ncbi:unnamed protein product [Urochloa decumbens]|uniref:Uncharacterized protein n=1 Tax=Urochloa decumbens TaxID=240449 RepID=A0ABC8Z3E9_9POAL
MAALPLCASWFPPAAVAVASHSARPTGRVMRVRSLCRRGPTQLALPVRQARARDHLPGREPEPESDDDEPDMEASIEAPFVDTDDAEDEELRKKYGEFCASMGLREAPDMFPIEREEISNYLMRIASSRANDLDVNKKVMALIVCAEAQKALDLASRIMDLMNMASLDLGTPVFSQDTINKMVRTYAPIFVNVAKDAYSKTVEIDTVLSFLDALRGLGAICHILVQDTVAMLKDAPLEKSINSITGTHSFKFEKRLNNLKEEFMASADATGIKHTLVMDMLFDGMKHTQSYIDKLIHERGEALYYLSLAQAASTYEALRKNC